MTRLERAYAPPLAYVHDAGRAPCVVFLPGLASDMTGTKATALRAWCAARGQAFLSLDYAGHGRSGGRLEDGTISAWTNDARAVLAHAGVAARVLVGSSMGGWIALRLARADPGTVGLLGLAAAPDFTGRLMLPAMSAEQLAALDRDGVVALPSDYGPPLRVTRALIEDGDHCAVLDARLTLACPVRLIQGQRDPDVPWRHALALLDAIDGPDTHLTLVKDGDHRLSRGSDLRLIDNTLSGLLG